MDGFLESLQVEFIVALVFAILGVVISKLLTPIISDLVYRHTRKYPYRRIYKISNFVKKRIPNLLKKILENNDHCLSLIRYKYDIYTQQGEIYFSFSKFKFLNLNKFNIVTGEIESDGFKSSIYSPRPISLRGYYKTTEKHEILFIEENHSNFPNLTLQKCEYILDEKSVGNIHSPEPMYFGHGIKYYGPEERIISFQSILTKEIYDDLFEIIIEYQHHFSQEILDKCTRPKQIIL